jgi:hypothetical protein
MPDTGNCESSKVGKIERYNWTRLEDTGLHKQIAIRDLKVDPAYQRGEVSESNTLGIAANFSWAAFSTLTVMKRKDGRLFVVDGMQRLCAVKHRDDIVKVPCIIFPSRGRDHEAYAFLLLNTHRRPVRATEKFAAAVKAKISPEIEVDKWLKSHDLVVGKNDQPKTVRFIAQLLRQWRTKETVATRALEVHLDIVGDNTMHVHIQKGLYWLVDNGIPVEDHCNKMIEQGGKSKLLQAICGMQAELAAPSVGEKTAGLGILRVINHRKKIKIKIRARKT